MAQGVFAPPGGDEPEVAKAPLRPGELAPLWMRFVGFLVDSGMSWGLTFSAVVSTWVLRGYEGPDWSDFQTDLVVASIVLIWFVLVWFNWILITLRGQSIGKWLVGSRIVGLDGAPVGFLRGVVLRNWPLFLGGLMLRPFGVEMAVYFCDGLLVVEGERRAMHDRIAGTKVVIAGP